MRETDIKRLAQQRALLDFPALLRFLQTSLVPELRLRGHSSALVHHAIEPLTKMKFLSGAAQVSACDIMVQLELASLVVIVDDQRTVCSEHDVSNKIQPLCVDSASW